MLFRHGCNLFDRPQEGCLASRLQAIPNAVSDAHEVLYCAGPGIVFPKRLAEARPWLAGDASDAEDEVGVLHNYVLQYRLDVQIRHQHHLGYVWPVMRREFPQVRFLLTGAAHDTAGELAHCQKQSSDAVTAADDVHDGLTRVALRLQVCIARSSDLRGWSGTAGSLRCDPWPCLGPVASSRRAL